MVFLSPSVCIGKKRAATRGRLGSSGSHLEGFHFWPHEGSPAQKNKRKSLSQQPIQREERRYFLQRDLERKVTMRHRLNLVRVAAREREHLGE